MQAGCSFLYKPAVIVFQYSFPVPTILGVCQLVKYLTYTDLMS